MVSLDLLEQKFALVSQLIHDLREKNVQLELQNNDLKKELGDMRTENERLAIQSLQLAIKLDEFDKTSDGVDSLTQEREKTKLVVDNLIKNIDSLVSSKEDQL